MTALLMAAATTVAGQQETASPRTFRDAVDVTEVTVPVWVLANRRAVTGLTVDDFLLFDRGKRQEIIGFEVLDRSRPAAGDQLDAASADAADRSGATFSRRNFLVLFDLHRLAGPLAMRAVTALRSRLTEPMPQGDRWGIALHGLRVAGDRNMSARLLVGFTNERARLLRGLDAVAALLDRRPRVAATILQELAGSSVAAALRDGSASERFDGLSRSAALTLLATGAKRGAQTGRFETGIPLGWLGVEAPEGMVRDAEEGWFGKSSRIRVSDGSAASRLRWFALALADLVTFLRDVPGENHLLLLSPGGYGPLSDSFTTARMKPMLAAFKRNGWTFQAIDVSGRGFRASDMFYMANETGGTLVENFADLRESFDRVAERTSVTYLLTFRPPNTRADGKLHKLEVKLRDKSRANKIRHRAGYYAPAPAGEGNALGAHLDVMEAVLGNDEITDIDVEITVGQATAAAGRFRVPVVVAVDGATLLEGHRSAFLQVKVEGYALDAAGGVGDLFVDEATIDLARVSYLAGNRLRLRRELDLPAGEHRLRVWVENVDTGRASLTTTLLSLRPP